MSARPVPNPPWEIPATAREPGQPEAPEPAAQPGKASKPGEPGTARELLEMMPGALNPAEAQGLTAVYQFDVSGSEDFSAHLVIVDGQATFHEGRLTIPTSPLTLPPDVWLAIARKELDGSTAYLSGQFRIKGTWAC